MANKDTDRVNPVQVQKFLKGIDYPVSKTGFDQPREE